MHSAESLCTVPTDSRLVVASEHMVKHMDNVRRKVIGAELLQTLPVSAQNLVS